MYDFPPGSVTVCPLFSGHFQGNDVGVGFPALVELLVELLAESLAELAVAEADSLLLVSEDPVELVPALEDVSEFVVVRVSVDVAETDCELESELVVPVSEVVVNAESVPELELEPVVIMPDDIDSDELMLELELDKSVMVDEPVLTEFVRVLTEVVLPVAEPELDELDESRGGPAEYTMAPEGWGIR
jgi:hypothetical protein